ncbi:hypothetical protein [Bradyrhizobium viridifuturi]|uniref:hypothetical protein n=1 Tax=Bradyrhizobium viridifuturi TaxID=1654716 RepID=UPI000AFA761D|nr:hypothetical protein [Bradyrhizobium viridifuturi]
MKFFREAEPGIFITTGRLQTEQDGCDWTAEYSELLAADRPLAVIVNVNDQPEVAAGKPMVLWMKARKAELGRLIRVTVYIADDDAERAELERTLPDGPRRCPIRLRSPPARRTRCSSRAPA